LLIKAELTGKIKQQKFLNELMQGYSDEQLIEVYRTTDGKQRQMAFNCLYMRYSEAVCQYFFFALNRDHEKAKDFAHDLFLKILESPDKFDISQNFKPWLFRVASNMCKNEYRRQEVISRFYENAQILRTNYTFLNEQEAKLSEALKKLPGEKRSLIVLRLKINMSIKEIAKIYQCPEGTVKSRLFYALKELSEFYKD
jgi:RNA polymerase sigma-70 factor (ECF subfamily)